MELTTLLSLIVFSASLLGSPGPATISLAASGVSVGYKKTFPYLCGLTTGFGINLITAIVGIGYIFANYPTIANIFKVISFAYILYIAYKIMRSATIVVEKKGKRLSYLDGVLLNLTNPKAYIAAIAVISQFTTSDDYYRLALIVVIVNLVVAFSLQFLWSYAGSILSKFFTSPQSNRNINVTFAILLVASVSYVLLMDFL